MKRRTYVFVGTYTEAIRFGTGELFQGKGAGIHVFGVDLETGAMQEEYVSRGVKNPSYLCFHPSGRYLYAVNELKSHEAGAGSEGGEGGTVSSFAVGQDGRSLTFLNRRATGGTDPCHVTTDRQGRFVMVANFMSGSVSLYPILDDGSLGDTSDFVQHSGSSVDPTRQSGPHAHSSVFDPANRFVFVPDLGMDRIVAYRFDAERGKIAEAAGGGIVVTAGSGPRHLVFSPDGAFVYVVNELDSTITACSYDTSSGAFAAFETVSTLPGSYSGSNSCADINVHPSGDFLYCSNRGHDSIVAFRRDASQGKLHVIGHVPCGGKTPRNFAIDPTGRLMLVANQASDTIAPYLIDAQTGALKATKNITEVGTPVCLKFLG